MSIVDQIDWERFDTADLTNEELANNLVRKGKCDYCGKVNTLIEIGINWACQDNPTCKKIIEGRIQAAGMSGYDDFDDARPSREGFYKKPSSKFTSKPKKHLRFDDGGKS